MLTINLYFFACTTPLLSVHCNRKAGGCVKAMNRTEVVWPANYGRSTVNVNVRAVWENQLRRSYRDHRKPRRFVSESKCSPVDSLSVVCVFCVAYPEVYIMCFDICIAAMVFVLVTWLVCTKINKMDNLLQGCISVITRRGLTE